MGTEFSKYHLSCQTQTIKVKVQAEKYKLISFISSFALLILFVQLGSDFKRGFCFWRMLSFRL